MKIKWSAQKIQRTWRFDHQRKTNIKREWKSYSFCSLFRCPRPKLSWQLPVRVSSLNSFLVCRRNGFHLAITLGSSLYPRALQFPFLLSVLSVQPHLSRLLLSQSTLLFFSFCFLRHYLFQPSSPFCSRFQPLSNLPPASFSFCRKPSPLILLLLLF